MTDATKLADALTDLPYLSEREELLMRIQIELDQFAHNEELNYLLHASQDMLSSLEAVQVERPDIAAARTALDDLDDFARMTVGVKATGALKVLADFIDARAVQVESSWNEKIRDSVDRLLAQAGYASDSSARHQLACMNFDSPAVQVEPVACSKDVILEALQEYLCSESVDDDGGGSRLADVLTHGGDVGPGLREIEALADFIWGALSDATPQQAAAPGVPVTVSTGPVFFVTEDAP